MFERGYTKEALRVSETLQSQWVDVELVALPWLGGGLRGRLGACHGLVSTFLKG